MTREVTLLLGNLPVLTFGLYFCFFLNLCHRSVQVTAFTNKLSFLNPKTASPNLLFKWLSSDYLPMKIKSSDAKVKSWMLHCSPPVSLLLSYWPSTHSKIVWSSKHTILSSILESILRWQHWESNYGFYMGEKQKKDNLTLHYMPQVRGYTGQTFTVCGFARKKSFQGSSIYAYWFRLRQISQNPAHQRTPHKFRKRWLCIQEQSVCVFIYMHIISDHSSRLEDWMCKISYWLSADLPADKDYRLQYNRTMQKLSNLPARKSEILGDHRRSGDISPTIKLVGTLLSRKHRGWEVIGRDLYKA